MINITRFSDIDRWRKRGRWVLVYGRRKTGKTYFIKNFTEYDKYFFIGRSREIFIDNDRISYETFLREVYRDLADNKSVVIDEFQRLPDDFQDMLHNIGVKGRLTLVSSTLKLTEKLIGRKSPLLGLFTEFKMSLIDEKDILMNMRRYVDEPRDLIENSVYLREPWLIPLWENTRGRFLEAMLENIGITVPALIGEIFTEEERGLSLVYEGILRSIADGKRHSGEIASQLYSHKIIPAENPSLIHPYLVILKDIGMLEKIKIFNKNKYYYYLISPIMDLYYYLDAKYGFSERMMPKNQLLKVLGEKLPIHVEQFMGNLLAKIFGFYREKIVGRDYEIDIALTDFKRLRVVAEVKWRRELERGEIKRVEEMLGKFDCRKILIVPDKDVLTERPEGIEIWDVKTILSMIEETDKA